MLKNLTFSIKKDNLWLNKSSGGLMKKIKMFFQIEKETVWQTNEGGHTIFFLYMWPKMLFRFPFRLKWWKRIR